MSMWPEILSGIPQGSVLCSILLVIFINDLPDVVKSTVKIFADDTKLFREVRSVDGSEKLQQDLDNLALWSQKWQLGFNESEVQDNPRGVPPIGINTRREGFGCRDRRRIEVPSAWMRQQSREGCER